MTVGVVVGAGVPVGVLAGVLVGVDTSVAVGSGVYVGYSVYVGYGVGVVVGGSIKAAVVLSAVGVGFRNLGMLVVSTVPAAIKISTAEAATAANLTPCPIRERVSWRRAHRSIRFTTSI